MTIHVVLNYLWLAPWKLCAFSMNRGCLQKAFESGSLRAFTIALLLNVNVAFEAKPIDKKKKTDNQTNDDPKEILYAHDDVRFSVITYKTTALLKELLLTLTQICFKMVIMLIACYLFTTKKDTSFIRDVYFCWYAYTWGSSMQDASLVISLLVVNLKLEDSYNQPYLADSFTDFWARRWNRVMGTQLRDLCYEPVVDGMFILTKMNGRLTNFVGQWIAPRKYFAKREKSFIRRLIGIGLTFLASGVIHWVLLMTLFPDAQFPLRHIATFIISPVTVGLELAVRSFVQRSKCRSKLVKKIPKLLRILFVHLLMLLLAHLFFLPDLYETGFIAMVIEPGMNALKSLSII
eukprot:g6590.t1